jgi:phenylalanyl-tRNA synthetase beta subunit
VADSENLNLRVTHAISRDERRVDHDQRARVLNIALRLINHRCGAAARAGCRAQKNWSRIVNGRTHCASVAGFEKSAAAQHTLQIVAAADS